ncbi:TatD family hydrolase [Spiroplasma endosymbiont of Aspidapion aeneum]|uniref:TatD family hydrolase n=1 Tax=Spiroplasma endosymbiont of Aspidapion aeneum TaxID=3066276 RepID=UPI00313A9D93
MIGLFDAHTHLFEETYVRLGIKTSKIIEEALTNQVAGICCSGFDVASSEEAAKYSMKYDIVYASVGVHPDQANTTSLMDLTKIDDLCFYDKVVAVGEIGLDYFVKKLNKDKQIALFEEQLKIAKKHDLPVVLHVRDIEGTLDAYKDALKILKKHNINKGILHCFTQDYETAKSYIDSGFYISIGGIVTFDNAKEFQSVVEKISINNIVIETDAPYLTPVPKRGTVNFPKYIGYTAKKISELKKLPLNDVINTTCNNAKKVFKIK